MLKEGDKINLYGIYYRVMKSESDCSYFLNNRTQSNDSIFRKLDINKKDFSIKVLGYYRSGDFPECNNLKDLYKLVNALKKEIMKQDKWCVKVTKENAVILREFYAKHSFEGYRKVIPNKYIGRYLTSHNRCSGDSIFSESNGSNFDLEKPNKIFPEISFEEFKNRYLQEENKLPEKWYFKGVFTDIRKTVFTDIRKTESTKVWEYFKEKFNNDYRFYQSYYYLSNGKYYKSIPKGYIEITFQQLEEYLINQEMKTYKITAEEAKEIFDTVSESCSWKKRLAELWGTDIMLSNDITITEELLQEGLEDASSSQKELINKYVLKQKSYSWKDLEYGQAVLTSNNEIMAKTYDGWVDLNNMINTYNASSSNFTGKLVTPKISVD